MTRLLRIVLAGVLVMTAQPSIFAQDQISVPACDSLPKPKKFVGDRLRLAISKGATVKKGRDVDYEDYYVGFGEQKNRVWLSGIFGPTATGGMPSDKWMADSKEVRKGTWKSGVMRGNDIRGRLANGNYWRYFGTWGESFEYYDVSPEAAAFFDEMIKNVCYQEWKL
jgi:hypothetical protein